MVGKEVSLSNALPKIAFRMLNIKVYNGAFMLRVLDGPNNEGCCCINWALSQHKRCSVAPTLQPKTSVLVKSTWQSAWQMSLCLGLGTRYSTFETDRWKKDSCLIFANKVSWMETHQSQHLLYFHVWVGINDSNFDLNDKSASLKCS